MLSHKTKHTFWRWLVLAVVLSAAWACGGTGEDLSPSSKDLRVQGAAVGSSAGPVLLPKAQDTFSSEVDLMADLQQFKAVLLYFTMWCPVCDTHSQSIRDSIVSQNSDVKVYLVDYVSSEVTSAWGAQMSGGYSDFSTLVDADNALENMFQATMGSTVVISSSGNLLLNESYKDGQRVQSVLESL